MFSHRKRSNPIWLSTLAPAVWDSSSTLIMAAKFGLTCGSSKCTSSSAEDSCLLSMLLSMPLQYAICTRVTISNMQKYPHTSKQAISSNRYFRYADLPHTQLELTADPTNIQHCLWRPQLDILSTRYQRRLVVVRAPLRMIVISLSEYQFIVCQADPTKFMLTLSA